MAVLRIHSITTFVVRYGSERRGLDSDPDPGHAKRYYLNFFGEAINIFESESKQKFC
jgi:hypothetical protein